MQMAHEGEYLSRSRARRVATDKLWGQFLSELAGAGDGHRPGVLDGAQQGVRYLRRDARGVISFDASGSDSRPGVASPLGMASLGMQHHLQKTAESARGGDALRLLGLHGGSSTPVPLRPPKLVSRSTSVDGEEEDLVDRETLAAEETVRAMQVFKRVWSVGSIGVPSSTGSSTPEIALASVARGLAAFAEEPGGVGADGKVISPERRGALFARLQMLVTAGIPAAFRGSVWYALSGAASKRALHPSDYYSTLAKCRADATALRIVKKDVPRTFPGHPFFETDDAQEALARLLLALAAHNPRVGYCQSLNFVAGILLWMMPEENAFWVMDVLLNEILPAQFWSPDMAGCRADQIVLEQLVRRLLPRLHKALSLSGLPASMVTTEWFVALFSTVLPIHVVLRVWDCLFLFGSEVLFRVSIAILARAQSRLSSLGIDFGEVAAATNALGSPKPVSASTLAGLGGLFQLLKTMPFDIHDEDALIYAACPPPDTTTTPDASLPAASSGRRRTSSAWGGLRRVLGRKPATSSTDDVKTPSGTTRTAEGRQPPIRWGTFGLAELAEARERAWHSLRSSGEKAAGSGAPIAGRDRAVGSADATEKTSVKPVRMAHVTAVGSASSSRKSTK
jgi:hypothetical protein